MLRIPLCIDIFSLSLKKTNSGGLAVSNSFVKLSVVCQIKY